VANHFYTDVPGDYVVLELDARALAGEVKWEPAADVGDKETFAKGGAEAEAGEEQEGADKGVGTALFPHLYGGIPKSSPALVGRPLPVTREEGTGRFLSIQYPFAQVAEGVYIASSSAAASEESMRTLCATSPPVGSSGMWGVLTLTAQASHDRLPLFAEALVGSSDMTHTVTLRDDADDLSSDLPVVDALGFMERARSAGHRVLVVSSHAASRAAAVVVAYQMFKNASKAAPELARLRAAWPRANPNRNFLSQLLELEQGDGNDPSVALRAVAAGLHAQKEETEKVITEDEIERVIEIDEDAPAPADLDDDDDDMDIDMDDDARMMAAAAAAAGDDDRDTAPVDALPEEVYVETARSIFRGHADAPYCVAVSPTVTGGAANVMVASGGGDDMAYVWDPRTGETVHELRGHSESVCSIAFNHDGSLLATAALDGGLRVWNAATGQLVQALEGPEEDIHWISWHPKGNVILAGAADMLVWMWMATKGDCMQVFSGHSDGVTCGTFTPDGKGVVTGSVDGTVRVWNPKSGKCRHVFGQTDNKTEWHDRDVGGILCLAVSDDNTTVLTGGEDGTARMVTIVKKKERYVDTLKHRREGNMNGHVVEAVGFSPSSNSLPLVFTAGSAGLLIVWDRNTRERRYEVRHTNGVVQAGFTALAPILWTCSSDETACLWDARSGALAKTFTGHRDVILGCAALPMPGAKYGGVALVTCSDDQTCRVFWEEGDGGAEDGGEEKH
jgi:ribosome assembly protein SQT1